MRRKTQFFLEEEIEEPLLNLTPLLDVIFVVLISFMLMAPILDVDQVDLATSGVGKSQMMQESLAIQLHADNSIWFQGKKMSFTQLEDVLKRERKKGQVPQLFADKQAHFGRYQEIKNVLEACGFEQMDVILYQK